ncbi:hypothetical protein [Aquipuribacter nitratireducens]|uniref:Uncharacterized protein n=1 Tax=Aquipuribacter nitratireducens TaxID=650104 RepID=A0ABW0GJJ1_9MICO
MAQPNDGSPVADAWRDAAADAAHRIDRERGVVEPWSVDVLDGDVVVQYGDLRVATGGATGVAPAQLHAVLDHWVAWQREGGPGSWLVRDEEELLERRRLVDRSVSVYREAASLVAADLARTLGEVTVWTVVAAEHVTERPDAPQAGRPPVPTIEVAVETLAGGGVFGVAPLEAPSLRAAVAALLSAGEDHLAEIVHGRWPRCAEHSAPMAPGDAAGPVPWTCAAGGHVVAEVGRLRGEHVLVAAQAPAVEEPAGLRLLPRGGDAPVAAPGGPRRE